MIQGSPLHHLLLEQLDEDLAEAAGDTPDIDALSLASWIQLLRDVSQLRGTALDIESRLP